MVFPGEMMINIDPKEFSYVRLLKGFTSKGEKNAGVKFLLSEFKNYVVGFLYINWELIAFLPNINILEFIIKYGF